MFEAYCTHWIFLKICFFRPLKLSCAQQTKILQCNRHLTRLLVDDNPLLAEGNGILDVGLKPQRLAIFDKNNAFLNIQTNLM